MKQLYKFIAFIAALGYAGSAFAQVKGTVFRDFDLNGIRSDTLPVEVGVSGIKVLAFVDLSKIPIQTVTDARGNYTFNATDVPAGKSVRIEFSELPSSDYNGPYGAGSGTTVQFVKAPADQVNIGINYPSDYCQRTDVRVLVPCYINGNTQTTTDANGNFVPVDKQAGQADALVSIAYNANGVAGSSNFPPDHLATGREVGSIWALAYHRRTKKAFSAAVVKRHTSFGPLGTGGIYVTDVKTNTTTNFLDVKTIGIDTGDDFHSGIFADKTQASTDPASMTAMGRVSFGGMDISEDDKTLYFINLKDRKLYSVFINSPAVAPTSVSAVNSWAIPDPGCSDGDFRPWALKVYRGKIYVGVVCSAETSQKQSDLKATIYRFDPRSATPVFEEILSFPLDFRRGAADLTGTCVQYDHWLPWTDAFPTPCGEGNTPNFVMYPQPILSDLEFDDDGSMIVGFMDRFGHLVGVANLDPEGKGFYDGFTGGDILRAYNNNGKLELEKNGKSGNLTGSGVGNNEGPVDANNVGGEFFGLDNWLFFNRVAHAEVTNGALSLIPGYKEVLSSAFDPISEVYQSGGLKVFNTQTGAVNRNYVLYTLDSTPGSFGKAAGLGDSKALCDPPGVEIGNRVWFDDNRDGIQDAYEPGIDGIVLTLHDMENGGALLATQTSHDGGQYYFNDSVVPGGLQFNHKYEVRLDTTQLSNFDITLAGSKILAPSGGRRAAGARQALTSPQRYYFLSPANQTGFADPDTRDSDAQLVGSSAVIGLTTLDAGQNDFTYDVSIYSCPSIRMEKDIVSLCSDVKLDSMAAVGDHFSRVDSVRFVMFSSPQSGTAMYGSTGVVLGTVKPDTITNRAVFYNPPISTVNNQGTVVDQYVYAIIYPTPANIACRQSDATVIKVSPSLSATATGGTLTCSLTAVSLQGQAFYGDGSVASGATYGWSGPNGFSSTLAAPVVAEAGTYTLTVSDPACPSSLTTATATVTFDTVVPDLTAGGAALPCVGCSATLFADAPEATLFWTGPGGFTSALAEPTVTVPGDYTVTAKGVNGCEVSTVVELSPIEAEPCPVPACLPILIKRIK
ncbi:SdrD B-like domain-containing protein [Spirosoma aerophilum]